MKIFRNLFLILCCFLVISCASDENEQLSDVIEPVPVVEVEEVIPEPVIEEIPVVMEQISKEDQEYSRSVTDLGVDISKETFSEDKAEILQIIEKLSAIMKYKDYASWLNYLTQESREFWSNQQNLAIVSQRLPIKNYRLKNLQDYFEKVFIPSRIGRVVDEIRYVSTTKVKAVQYTEEQDIIYYYFEKINDRWYLHLDTTT